MKFEIVDKVLDKISQRLIKNWVTTLLGVAIIIGSLVAHFVSGLDWTGTIIGICIGVVLLPMKDDSKAAMIVLLVLFSSCVTIKRCRDKFGTLQVDTIQYVYKGDLKVEYKPPAEWSSFSLRLDSLLWARPGDTATITNEAGTVTTKMWKDADNDRLFLETECDPDTLRFYYPVEIPMKVPCETWQLTDKPSRWDKFKNTLKNIAVVGFFITSAILILKR